MDKVVKIKVNSIAGITQNKFQVHANVTNVDEVKVGVRNVFMDHSYTIIGEFDDGTLAKRNR